MTTEADTHTVLLDGASLTLPDLAFAAGRPDSIAVSGELMATLDVVHENLVAARASGTVYGANTGVGANRSISVSDGGDAETSGAHTRRLLRSHCAGVGTVEDDETSRAVMIVRLNQFLAGGSGISGAVGSGLLEAITSGCVPTLHRLGAIGTADLAPLAELALTLTGERPWRSGHLAPVPFADSDALPFMSSSALTLATAAFAAQDLKELLESATVVAALSFLALDGSAEAYDDIVQQARRHPRQADVAAALRHLVGSAESLDSPSARLQDPFGLRVMPQVHAPAVDAIARLITALETEINAASENPLVTTVGVRHHGQFHLATLAAALDHVRTSIYPTLTLSAARLGMLFKPEFTGLAPFLAAGSTGSSGLMITEYVVQDVLADLRISVAPVSGGSVSISLGMEEHASFASQGARLLREVSATAPTIIAIEAVAAVRALRMAPARLRTDPARAAYEFLARELDAEQTDRPLGDDIERASSLLPGLRQFVGDGL